MKRRGERAITCGFRRGPDGARMAIARLDAPALEDLVAGGAVVLKLPLNEEATEQVLVLVVSPWATDEQVIEMAKAVEGWKPTIPLRRK
jgi:hypothetical protein